MSAVVLKELQGSLQPLGNRPNPGGNRLATDHDLEIIWKWNATVPETIHGCVHDLITHRAQLQPDAQAICAWDGDWSYRQLDELSTTLAYRLVDMGVGPDVLVPLCFQKSKWTPVAMLSVMKAGGASIALEPSLPQERLRTVVRQVEPHLMLCSSLTVELAKQLTTQPLIVIDDLTLDHIRLSSLPEVRPWNKLYVIFTSGSTGTPKGTIITHSNICSTIHHQRAAQGYSSSWRVYDFAKYSFDITWSNFIHTLTAGACLCIPSQHEVINNLVGSIQAYNANFVNMTPSVGSMLRPSDLSGTLEHIVFAGEALPTYLAAQWAQHARVMNLYGPAECAVGATLDVIGEPIDMSAVAASIGRGFGFCTWVVDPSCHDKLVPVGEVGELLLEGPIVGAGYLGDAEKTAAVFIENPRWLAEGPPHGTGRNGRLYKTGDLVRYEANGNLAFIGRKDSQVKINGQRVELGDIEYHVRQLAVAGPDLEVVAELVSPRDSDKPLIVVFMQIMTPTASNDSGGLELEMNRMIDGLNERLAAYLPAYMIPSAYIPFKSFPKTPNGKLDRRKLRELYKASTTQELTAQASTSPDKSAPTAVMELRLRALWATVLGRRDDDIGSDDNFLHLGGDSIAAMKLVGIARDHGLSLSVSDIFNHPVLDDMSAIVGEVIGEASPIEQFSLLRGHIDVSVARRQAADACGVNIAEIEDIFPCTPLQEGLVALTAKHTGDYISRHVFQLHPKVDTDRLRKAWNRVVSKTPILRTRIVDLSQQGLVQVVVNQSPTWASTVGFMSLEGDQHGENSLATALGAPLVCFGLVEETRGEEMRRFFVWTIHHALYDGWSKSLLLETLAQTYVGETPAGTSAQFQSFVKHIMDIPSSESSKFWSAQFEHFEAQIFPELPSPRYEPRSNQLTKHSIAKLQWPSLTGVTASTTLRAAWSILTSWYSNANDTVFGVTVSGRQAAVRGVDQMTGPTIATVPVRIPLNMRNTIAEFLVQLQRQSVDMTAFEQTGLQQIRRLGPEAERACDFRTLLVVQPAADEKEKHACDGLFVTASNGEQWSQVEDHMAEFRTYPLSLECQLQDDGVVVSTRFDSAVFSDGQVVILMRQFEHVLRRLCHAASHQTRLEDIELVGREDLDQIWRWNSAVPEPAKVLVRELIDTMARQQPEAQAVCAWDGNWTYAELDRLSSHLACVLIDSGVGPDVVVPLCIEKSKWMPVAMMAVMKAGGASLALDSTQPEDRLRSIVDQVGPIVVLTSAANQNLARRLAPHSAFVVVVVSEEHLASWRAEPTVPGRLPAVDPTNKLYLVFTSGSTGQPKGVVVTHENIASAILHQRETLRFSKHSRIYDFASYMFDVVWCNLLHGLSAGGCICIPSNDDRRDDPLGTAARLGANTAILTPSTIRGLDLQPLQCLGHIHFIGEPLSAEDMDGLPSHIIVTNLYGPTECTTFGTAQQVLTDPSSSNRRIGIGAGRGLRTWLVKPADHSKLVPLGCVGEVLLEGPLVAAGYLGAEEATAAAFFHDPVWLLEGSTKYAGRRGRLYKTGDLARYDADGNLYFLGRKDSQVKISGQRVELGDIEHHVRANISYHEDVNVVAEVVRPTGSDKAMLMAFIQVSSASGSGDEDAMRSELDTITAGLEERLLAHIPAYIMPSAYVPIENIPVTSTGKIDRRKLRALGQQLTFESLMGTKLSLVAERRQPATAVEKALQGLWSAVLGVSSSLISAEDNFLRIGGDSITAMRLVAAARKQRIFLTVTQVFQHPVLSDLAKVVTEPALCASGRISHHKHEPFALLRAKVPFNEIQQIIANKIDVEPGQIEDAFPCSPLQEGLLALTAKRPGDYVARFVYPLRLDVDTEHFVRAWEAVVSATPILRTRIIDLGEAGLVQVIVNEPTTWVRRDESLSLEAYELADRRLHTGLGMSMTRFSVIRDPYNDSRFFVWTIHHALYDGWSVSLMLQKLEAAFYVTAAENMPSSPPLQTFIKHIENIDQNAAAAFWHGQFAGLEAEIFPAIPSSSYQAISSAFIKHRILDLPWPKNEITPSMMVRAAWSMLATKLTDRPEAVFGVTVSGRQAAVVDVEQMIGPTIATIPVRVALDWSGMTVKELLQTIQAQAIETTAFEQTGLQNIRRVSSDAEKGCSFQTLLVVHPVDDIEEDQKSIGNWFIARGDKDVEDDTTVTEHDTYALTIECTLERHGLKVRVAYDPNILNAEQVKRLATQFEHTLRQICMPKNASKTLSSIDMVSAHDMHTIWDWNKSCPGTYSACLHDVISSRSQMQPDALAVNAWDGDFSYSELDSVSTRLAYYLASLGVKPETIIPLYFEKSKWTPIAMLAVMKAGGASVLMDSSQPQDRLQAIIDQTAPIMVVTSARNERRASELTNAPVVAVCSNLIERLHDCMHREAISLAQPWNKAYLIFTSGSTGTPKGAILTHENVCSALRYQQVAQGYRSDARVYDFASYAFDTAWNNFMHTFTVGACLCIPSEDERKDDLPGSIIRFKPTILDITPSAATALGPRTIQSLRTLILGGERLSSSQAKTLGALVDVKVAYGPCECTPTATVTTIDPKTIGDPGIGHGIGTITWITDPIDHNTLVPVGAIGELLLEGPLVGAGYLDDDEKSKAAFIHNPVWLLRGGAGKPGREGRLYKTGDLVRYNSDGTLIFFGRKDAQVKINGQRVELGEVESHMARCHSTRQCLSLYPQTGPIAKRLVGFSSLRSMAHCSTESSIELVDASHHSETAKHIQALEVLLSEALPSYMVPSVWIVVRNIPLNPSGKLNRRLVEDWLLHMDSETLAKINSAGCPAGCAPPAREPKSDTERVVRDACSVILNMKSTNVNLETSFISNGGDSISAMRLSSYCRAANLNFSVAMLLKSKTLAKVAQSSIVEAESAATRAERFREVFGQFFPLSPIQKWFFAQSHSDNVTKKDYYCNQGFYVKLKRHVSIEEVSFAIRMVVERHSMLRAQFQETKNGWMQRVPDTSDAVHHFGYADAQSLNEIKTNVAKSHQSLDIKRGLVFSADLYTLPSQDQYLILIGHHLVVDLVSWRIILDDLESLMAGKKLFDVFPFQQWNVLQANVAHSPDFAPTKVLSTQNAHNDHEFWGFTPATPNTASDHIRKSIELDHTVTMLLLKNANSAYNTEPVDLILSSIWDAFFRIFPMRKGLTIFNEGHGREPWTSEIDLSHTVGWFTTLSPIHVSRGKSDSAAHIVRQVKDARRRLPSNGWKYWVSRHLNEQGITAFASHCAAMEVQFNYHGQFQQLERPDSLFEAVDFDDEICPSGPLMTTSVLFDLDVVINRGVTKISFSWNRHLARQDSIQAWIAEINVSAQSLCYSLCNKQTEYTLCDYEFININYKDLDELREVILPRIEEMNNSRVVSLYPSSPMVNGILLSQIKGTGSYETSQTWLIKPRQSHQIDINALMDAWQSVIARHPSLRTVFIHSMDASVAFNTVVLKSFHGEIVLLESNSFDSALSMLKEVPRVNYSLDKPAHRLVLGTIQGDGRVLCKIEMSHAISDGASTSITMHDWAKAYAGELDTEELTDTTQEFTRALSIVSKNDKMAYWKSKLSGLEPCHFPRLVEVQPNDTHATATVSLELDSKALRQIKQFCEACSVTPASLFQCAWALTLSAYTGSDSVCFGYLASGRDSAIDGIMDSVGAFANVMICRVNISREWSGEDLIHHVHDQVLEDLNFQHCSVADVQHELGLPFGQGLFNSILSFQNDEDGMSEGIETQHLVFTDLDWEDPTEYEVTISIRHANTSASFTVDYRLACMSSDQARSVVSLVENIVTRLVGDHTVLSPAGNERRDKLSLLNNISEKDLQQVRKWNKTAPEAAHDIVHDLISNVARETPDAPAICSWDGDFTYAALDNITSKLAYHLVTLGVGSGLIVPLCFEKSKWMPVAMLAVMKAGAASVALDSALPEERLSSIIRQVDPIIILTSSATKNKISRLANCATVPLTDTHVASLDTTPVILPNVQPFDMLYVVFTSGSTGVPKGVVITHSNFSSAIRYQQTTLGFQRDSRVYDVVKYAFDVTWSNFLHTITAGGCLCIPSEADISNNLTDSLNYFRANFADLTPSVASTLRPADLTTLDHILFSGEALTTHVATQWAMNRDVLNTYGPAECTVKATFAKVGKSDASAASIGQGFGLCTWIVQPSDHNKLVPIGVVGELLLEGPLVGAGYLNDLTKTKEAFIDSPVWLVSDAKGWTGRKAKLYKTGDLVRYNADGSMTFIGRKDGQVKINGQRLELGDVEHHVRANLEHDSSVQVFAEVITPQASKNSILVAFIHFGEDLTFVGDDEHELITKITDGLNERLVKKVPGYMIPAVYISIDEIPMTATGKTDRRRLRELGEQLTLEELMALRVRSREIIMPSTFTEKHLQRLWAAILGINTDSISANDSFLRIGGDSIGAMKLVGVARQSGLALTVADVFQHPKLSDMAKIVRHHSQTEPEVIRPFSLLKSGIDPRAARDQVAQLCHTSPDHIQDIFPCSPLQEGLLALTAKRAGDYVAQYVLPLKDRTDIGRFRMAWENVLQMTPILRTRIVDLPEQGLVQAIFEEEEATWLQCLDVNDYQRKDKNMPMGLGRPLVRYSVTKMPDDKQPFVFVWTVHHALYDGWSMPRILSRLELAYKGDVVIEQCPPFQRFIQHILSISDERARQFWQGQFEKCEAQAFPKLPSAAYQPTANSYISHSIENLHWPDTDTTASTAIRAALVILTAKYTNSSDVIFGTTVSGREADVHGVDEMTGPTLATVPVRVVLDWDESVASCLHRIQTQHVQMTTFEQTGLQKIRQMGTNAKQACEFQTLLLIHPAAQAAQPDSQIFARLGQDENEDEGVTQIAQFDTYALTIECDLTTGGVIMRFEFDESVLSKYQVQKFAGQLEHILRQLCGVKQQKLCLKDIETISRDDLEVIWEWNAAVPMTVETPVHEIIIGTLTKKPEAPAVCAWDGSWNYKQLHDLSSRLAFHLVDLGVGPEVITPICFEKSRWSPIAILGVMKAGGVSVTLDSSLPEDRLTSVVQQVKPALFLSSLENEILVSRLSSGKPVVVIDEKLLDSLENPASGILPTVQPSNTLYITFTSGSTGTPKGVQITHSNFSSAIVHQRSAHNFDNIANARVYDFASFAFDTSWQNMLATFDCGGCLCIPSEAERRDDLAGSIERFGITHSELTPSAAMILPLSTLKNLNTLILGGERLQEGYAKQWATVVNVKNSYGPSECTPTSTVADVDPVRFDGANIGKGRGVNTWIVDMTTGDSLVPVGCIGELMLEGPLVGPGYLADPDKTASVFVENPSWLIRGSPGHPGRNGRLYKTGDLVSYNEDGTLTYVGRKDAQVKIRGQRVELGEIESHLMRHRLTRHSACFFPTSGPCADTLVSVFSIKNTQQDDDEADNALDQHESSSTRKSSSASSVTEVISSWSSIESPRTPDSEHSIDLIPEDYTPAVQAYIEEMQNDLGASLPSYMVPTKWIAVKNIPLNASGKLNRKQLEAWLCGMDETLLARLSELDDNAVCRDPQTQPERVLVDACSRVLNVQASQVNIGRSFVANGGDSISAMRLSPQCRAENVIFSVASLLKAKSLAEVAKLSSANTHSTFPRIEDFGRTFPLSPIQQWFFDQIPTHLVNTPSHYCNQSFCVRINRPVSGSDITHAVSKVIEQHSMLRARFRRQDDKWTQLVPEMARATYHFKSSSLNSMNELQALASRRQQSLDFERGLVFSADFCAFPSGEQYLVLIAHHLVIDLVSWRILLDDLETLLTGGTLMESLPFQIWNSLQHQEAKSSRVHPRNVLSTDGVNNDLAFWSFKPWTPNATHDHINKSFTIDQKTTALALRDANHAFNTEPVDLLLSAVWDAFFNTFSRQSLTIFNESHGRESWSADIDISRTVGWFTTMSPINMSRDDRNDRINLVRRIKDARRKLPANGWVYFSSRYLNSEGIDAFGSHNSVMEMSFNYHGQFQQLERKDSFFSSIELQGVSDIGPELPTSSLFNVNMSIEHGLTHVSFDWNRHISHQDLIIKWIEQIGPSLQSICETLVSRSGQKTLVDFEFLNLDYAGLDNLQSCIIPEIEQLNQSTVQDIYPCSPMVEGILLSQSKEIGLYETSQIYEVRPRGNHVISVTKLQAAWHDTISRHPSLRSVFIGSLDPNFTFNQVVLEAHYGEVVVLVSDTLHSAQALLQTLPKVNYQQLKPPHRLTLCQILDTGAIICQVEMSHTITDGASTGILVDDWAHAYKGMVRKDSLNETCREFARALVDAGDAGKKKLYWKKKLAGLQPSFFPALDTIRAPCEAVSWSTVDLDGTLFASLQRFCASQSITPSSLFHAAWALTLATYTGSDSVCFGYIASGRDLPIAGIEEAVGAFANIMVCRADISRDWKKHRFVQYLHHQVLEDLGHQHCSLADIQHDLGVTSGQQLFNTIMSFQKEIEQLEGPVSEEIDFVEADGDDPTEYDVAISITWGVDLARLFINCHPSRFTNDQCHRILTSLKTIVTNLVSDEHWQSDDGTLRSIDTISKSDLQDIWQWNSEVPESITTCLHDSIANVARKQPEKIAVNAWDGDWTYEELDKHSTQIAQHLAHLGIHEGDVVALYFQRSRWVPVAILAVLKMGGVVTLMDSSQPEHVLLRTMEQCKPKLLLLSDATKPLVEKLTNGPVLVVNSSLVGSLTQIHHSPLPRLQASAIACLIFSPGSTGPPKCVVLTHTHISTAAKYQYGIQGYHAGSRVYDFMSYASQIAWKVFAYTFISGACLCVPSRSEHEQSPGLSVLHWKSTILDITPSVAATLPDDIVKSLQTLIVGGEHLSSYHAKRLARLVDLKFTYGLSECTPVATVGTVCVEEADDPRIGKGVGMNTWITDMRDGQTLAPVGGIGELVLEGPLIGAGYLDGKEKISAAILDSPRWLVQGSGDPKHPGRTGRLFKTGDLVRYNKDGNLKFIARKEDQAKIHEPQVELEEVEHHMRRASSVQDAACLKPKSGRYVDKLVGVFSLDGFSENDGAADSEQTALQLISRDKIVEVQDCIHVLQAELDNSMPAYMVPVVWVPLRNMPVSRSGALDRKRLEAWLCNLDEETCARISISGSLSSKPSTMSETVIRDACSHVLNVLPNSINMQRSFIANGGDSISAMQVSPYCRAAGIVVSVASLLRAKKLADAAASASVTKGAPTLSYKEDFGQEFSLSPIQQWFFAQLPSGKVNTADYYCNQAFYVRVKRHVLSDKVATAIGHIVQQHSMLRAQFRLNTRTKTWTQSVPNPGDALYQFTSCDIDSLADVKSIITQRHQQLDIERGLVFSADLFSLPSGEQFLALIAHHLVVDLVSWRIILDDLENLLCGGSTLAELPFQTWQNLQSQEAQSSSFLPEKVLSSSIQHDLGFWNYTSATPNTFNDHLEHSFDVDRATTSILLKEANRAFNTEPVDLILASVWDAFFRTFSTRQGLTIFNEGHGREPWAPDIDISRTVGWFTTMAPMHISRDHTSSNIPRVVKDIRRQLLSNGWTYFASRYLNSQGIKAFESHDTVMEVLFNYHGQFQQLESDKALFENIVFDDIFDVGSSLPASALFSINVSVEGGLTRFTFSWNKFISHQNLIRDWMAQVAASMQNICSSLSALDPTPTVVDYEFLSIDYQQLDKLQNHILPAIMSENASTIIDVYPCLPMVEGMLLSQIRHPDAYKTLLTYEMRHHLGQRPLDVNQLVVAWQAVIARHPALRSVFVGGVEKNAAFSQVILDSYQGEVVVLEARDKTAAVTLIRKLPPVDYQQLKPPHRLVLCRTGEDDIIICQIEMSHTIVDGASTSILLGDWSKAYSRCLDTNTLLETNRNVVRALQVNPVAKRTAYWKRKLAGAEQCHFPRISGVSASGNGVATATASVDLTGNDFESIQKFCKSQSVTPASIFQSAWALLLSVYTGNSSVCFGYLALGRDIPVEGIEQSINAYANMLVCRANVSRTLPSQQFVQKLHDQVLEDLDYQHCSLADIQHNLQFSSEIPLFNTIVSFQKDETDQAKDINIGDLIFVDMDHEDPTEVRS